MTQLGESHRRFTFSINTIPGSREQLSKPEIRKSDDGASQHVATDGATTSNGRPLVLLSVVTAMRRHDRMIGAAR